GPIQDYVTQLGSAFGSGFTDTLKDQLTDVSAHIKDKITSKVVKWLVRIISALTIMIRNSTDTPTVLATLALLGCHKSPWSFLKDRLCQWLNITRPPSRQ
nr:2B [Rhinovirus C]